jgi:hypothetical protein
MQNKIMNSNSGQANWAVIAVVAVILAVAGFALLKNDDATQQPTSNTPNTNTQNPGVMKTPVVLDLRAQNNSGQTGKATLTEENDQTKIVLEVTPGPKGIAQPAHIHLGSCDQTPGSIKYNLNDVVDGKSETMLQPPLHFIHGLGTTLINIHKSKANYNTYAACGDLKAAFDAAMQ